MDSFSIHPAETSGEYKPFCGRVGPGMQVPFPPTQVRGAPTPISLCELSRPNATVDGGFRETDASVDGLSGSVILEAGRTPAKTPSADKDTGKNPSREATSERIAEDERVRQSINDSRSVGPSSNPVDTTAEKGKAEEEHTTLA